MKRIYACFCIVAVLLGLAFYSSWRVEDFAREISASLDTAVSAVRSEDYPAARKAVTSGAELCSEMRQSMSAFLRIEDFTELEASLRAADAYLEQDAAEEAFGEVRRAQVQVEILKKLAQRFL